MDKYFIIAGEVSGDIFAARLMEAINKKRPARFFGFGGEQMRRAGLEALRDDNTLYSAVGFLEALRFLCKQYQMLVSIVPYIQKNNITQVILVDHEFFSLLAADRIRKSLGDRVKIYFFIAPRVSMWGKKVAPWAASRCDALFCYMENDVPIYQRYKGKAFYFGNPLSEPLKSYTPDPDFFAKADLDARKSYAAIMPGSRKQEIKNLLPAFLKAAKRFHRETGTEFLMTIAHQGLEEAINKEILAHDMKHIVHVLPYSSLEIMSHCKYGLVSAGTVTLEAVMMGMYPIITYKVSSYTFKTIKRAEGLSDDTLIGLPNVFLKQRLFPELVQWEVNPDRIYQELESVFNMEESLYEYTMLGAKEHLSEALGGTNCFEETADYIVRDSVGAVWRAF